MVLLSHLLLAAQLGAVAPDTSLLAAFVRAVDTSVAPSGRASLRNRTIRVNLEEFARAAGVSLPPNVRLPGGWAEYRDEQIVACNAKADCGLQNAFANLSRIDRSADGSLVVYGTIRYFRLPHSKSSQGIAGGDAPVTVRLFQVVMRLDQGAWKISNAGVLEGA